ncbi:MAG: CPBP family glutamic-type intramembrane protease [Thermoguttaceae bacterium]|jgi:membrane protease YdiL (CAAX protease family)|nr:CPBP family glutamic-type intramembrane protease [Thermoguttaceae bacterium]
MPLLPLAQTPDPKATALAAALLVAVVASLAFWGVMFQRYRAGRPILPREPHPVVPWQGIDVLAVLAVYVMFTASAVGVVQWTLRPELTEPVPIYSAEDSDMAHAVLQAVATGHWWVLVLAAVAVVIVAPVAEEFLFRVLLQGWLEASVERWAPLLPNLRRLMPGASGPILLSSLLFAAAHFKVAGSPYHTDFLVAMMLGTTVAGVLAVCFGVVWLRFRVGATAADLGLVRARPEASPGQKPPSALAGDVRLGLWWLAGLLGPIYAVQIACHFTLPKYIAPDPIPLFFLALGLGILYARTHRLVPCIVLHAGLNAVSLTLGWATLPGP